MFPVPSIPTYVVDPVFAIHSQTKERVLLGGRKGLGEIWMFIIQNGQWTPSRRLSIEEVRDVYVKMPRLVLIQDEVLDVGA